MPGGHCPIVRPHHPPNQKNLPRVGDPPFIAAAWCGAHTKQARPSQPPKTSKRSNLYAKRIGTSLRSFGGLGWSCAAQGSTSARFSCIRTTILGHPNHGFSTHVLGCQNGVRKPCFFDPKTTLRKVVFWALFWGPSGNPKKVVPEPPKTWSRNPCF